MLMAGDSEERTCHAASGGLVRGSPSKLKSSEKAPARRGRPYPPGAPEDAHPPKGVPAQGMQAGVGKGLLVQTDLGPNSDPVTSITDFG